MSTAWPSTARTEFEADDAVRTTRVASIPQRQENLVRQAFQAYFIPGTFSSTTAADGASFDVYIPDYARASTRTLWVTLEAFKDAGVTAGELFLKNIDSGGVGSAVTVSAAVYTEYTVGLVCSSISVDANNIASMRIRGRITGGAGNLTYKSQERVTAWFSD